jgi:hypothetical protein
MAGKTYHEYVMRNIEKTEQAVLEAVLVHEAYHVRVIS